MYIYTYIYIYWVMTKTHQQYIPCDFARVVTVEPAMTHIIFSCDFFLVCHTYECVMSCMNKSKCRSLLQNIASFIGLFCKRDLCF